MQAFVIVQYENNPVLFPYTLYGEARSSLPHIFQLLPPLKFVAAPWEFVAAQATVSGGRGFFSPIDFPPRTLALSLCLFVFLLRINERD